MELKVEKRLQNPSQTEGNKKIMALIQVLVLVVLTGYGMIWIMVPTNTFRHIWMPSIRDKVKFTIYGTQGATLLIYTFPIMFVAVLGSLYLHLKKPNDCRMESYNKKHRLSTWRKPMLVKGPLGIVSGIEVAFLVMFMALLIWSFYTYLHSGFATITPQFAAERGEQVWEIKLERSGFWLGLIGNLCLAFLFFPVARGSSVLPLFGLTSESSIKYHIWLGHLVMVFFTAHGVCYIIYWIVTNQASEMLEWKKAGISNLAGELSLLAGLVLWATTFPSIRRKTFELFFYTHYFYILFMLFFVFHVGASYACIMLPGFYLFMVDRYLRFLQSRQRVRLVSSRVLPCQTLELNFSKTPGLRYTPTSILFVNVPSLSKLQWHPFTVISNSNMEPDRLSVMIKTEGSWTKKLYHMLSSTSSIDRLDVAVEGPYGPASTHFLRYDKLVMVCGGSGIAPFISIIKELIHASTTRNTPKVLLISAFKNSSDITMLDLILPISGTTTSSLANLDLKIEAFVTREKQPTTITNSKNIRTVWFKPRPTDEPITPILGTKNWLWLGAILASSFGLFLIIVGLITHYYINPIDKNTNHIFSYAWKAILNMLVLCICIGMTASFVVLWNKKHVAKDVKQIQHVEGVTPVASSLFYNTDRELESLPHQSLVQNTSVHYGERPDLKKMLIECEGENVGVLVCGPKKMRHEVAAICTSGLADNLHFESISFSW